MIRICQTANKSIEIDNSKHDSIGFATKITSISHQPPAGSANAQFDKTQFFLDTLLDGQHLAILAACVEQGKVGQSGRYLGIILASSLKTGGRIGQSSWSRISNMLTWAGSRFDMIKAYSAMCAVISGIHYVCGRPARRVKTTRSMKDDWGLSWILYRDGGARLVTSPQNCVSASVEYLKPELKVARKKILRRHKRSFFLGQMDSGQASAQWVIFRWLNKT